MVHSIVNEFMSSMYNLSMYSYSLYFLEIREVWCEVREEDECEFGSVQGLTPECLEGSDG